MYKKFAAIGLTTLLVTGCVAPAESEILKVNTVVMKTEPTTPLLQQIAEDRQISMQNLRLLTNSKRLETALESLSSHVGKTWYVFSGSTPSGWDCSGLTMWFYSQLGFELEHRASKQENAGTLVTEPKPGDLVVFKYNKSKSAYHVGVYVGNGKMIHAPRKGEVTRIESVKQFGGNYSKVSYVRFLETS